MQRKTEEMVKNKETAEDKSEKTLLENSFMLCNYLSTGQVGQKIKGEREL